LKAYNAFSLFDPSSHHNALNFIDLHICFCLACCKLYSIFCNF